MKIAEMLGNLNLEELEAKAYADVRSGKKTKRQEGVKILRAISGLKRSGVAPSDLLTDKVPIIPAQFRPYTVAGSTFVPGDANELYADLIKARKIQDQTEDTMGYDVDADRYVRNAVRAAYGYQDSPNPKLRVRKISGLMQKIMGNGPKTSFVQSKLLSKPQDFVGRGVIEPDPDLGMDEIGVPEDMAWELYSPFIRKRLISKGIERTRALKLEKDKDKMARQAMLEEMADRPVMSSRSPAWHHHNFVALWPKLTDSKAIFINPYITAGIAGDFNGDAQIGKIMVLLSKNLSYQNQRKVLLSFIDNATASNMIRNSIIPAFNTTTHHLSLVDLEDFPHGALVGSNPNGKNGSIQAYAVPPDTWVIGMDERSNTPVWSEVLYYTIHPDRMIEIVDLDNGRQIMTDDDPRAVYGIDPHNTTWELERFRPDEALAKKVLVPCVRDVAGACRNLGKLDTVTLWEGREAELAWDFGYLLGALCGDGWWDKRAYNSATRRGIYLSDLEQHNALRVHEILTALFGLTSWSRMEFKKELEGRYGDTVRHTFGFQGSVEFSEFLTRWLGGAKGENHSGSGSKVLPDFFLLACEDFRKGLLAGLVDTDGSVSVSNAKGSPQLMASITTTSRRLSSDIKLLCLTLGINAQLSFSKETSKGNTSWIVTLSAPDIKRTEGIFERLACPWKREAFVDTEVSQVNTSLKFDKVCIPQDVWEAINQDLIAPKLKADERTSGGEIVNLKKHQQNVFTKWWAARDNHTITRYMARKVLDELRRLTQARKEAVRLALDDLRRDLSEVDDLRVEIWREGMFGIAPKQGDPVLKSQRVKFQNRIKFMKHRKAALGGDLKRDLIEWLECNKAYEGFEETETCRSWCAMFVEVESITWTAVVGVQKTGKKEDGYDLTVPGYETFMSADGIILSNTMSVHVPVMDEAVKDAKEKLLPSKMLFSIRNRDKTLPVAKHEMILGLADSQLRPSGKVFNFNTRKDALTALGNGTIRLQDQVEIEEDRTAAVSPTII